MVVHVIANSVPCIQEPFLEWWTLYETTDYLRVCAYVILQITSLIVVETPRPARIPRGVASAR